MIHYTITTGHRRHSSRSEVGDGVIPMLAPLLYPGERALPGPSGYKCRTTVAGTTLAATAIRAIDGAPLATVLVCLDAEGVAAALRATGAIPAAPLAPPVALVDIHPTIVLDPDAIGWLGDWERCMAWAWIDHVERRSAASALGRQGGRVRTPAKAAAARANGRKGGRPPKK